MAGFNDVLKSLGYATGAVTGGPSQVKAVAGVVAAKGKIDSYLNQFGQKIGGYVGADLFDKLAAGAKVSADKETKAFVETKILSTDRVWDIVTFGSAALLIIVAYFFYKVNDR